MDDPEIEALIFALREAAEGMVIGHKQSLRSQLAVSTAVGLIGGLVEENKRLAAEVERLRPREMTLDECCEILNSREYEEFLWRVELDWLRGVCPASGVRTRLTQFEAAAVAEKLLRDAKEAVDA